MSSVRTGKTITPQFVLYGCTKPDSFLDEFPASEQNVILTIIALHNFFVFLLPIDAERLSVSAIFVSLFVVQDPLSRVGVDVKSDLCLSKRHNQTY